MALQKLRVALDKITSVIVNFIGSLGPNGYIMYGVFSNTLFFGASMVIKFFPNIDWTMCVITRGLVTFVFSYILSNTHNIDITYPVSDFKYITARNFIVSIQQVFFYYVITIVPIKIIWITNNTGPLFVFMLSACMLGTKLSARQIGFLMLSVLGINIITAPQLILKVLSAIIPMGNEADLFESEMDAYQILISLMFVFSIACWAFAVIISTYAKQATAVSMNHSLGLQLIIFGTLAAIFRADTITFPTIAEWIFIGLFVALPTFGSQLLYFQGTIVAKDQGMLSLTNYVPVIYSYIYQISFQSRIPGFIEILGVFFTFYGLYKVVIKPKHHRHSEPMSILEKEEEEKEILQEEKESKLMARLTL